MRSNDIAQVIRAWLMADTGITTEIGAGLQVLGAHVRDSEAQTILRAGGLLIVARLSGSQTREGAIDSGSWEVTSWSRRGSDEALRVYELAVARLQAARIKIEGLDPVGTATETERPIVLFVAELDAWAARGRWSVTMIGGGF